MKRTETTKMEFLMTLENNIVCQRFFNVKGFNPQVRRSLDLYDTFRGIVSGIQETLRRKSIDFLFENEKYFSSGADTPTAPAEAEFFTMQVKMGEDVIIARRFAASIYPPKIRYTVDVRPEIKAILATIADTMSQDEYDTDYLETSL